MGQEAWLPSVPPMVPIVSSTPTQPPVIGDDSKVAGMTYLTSTALAGSKILEVASVTGFGIGQAITIAPGTILAEENSVVAIGSLVCSSPLLYTHAEGTVVAPKAPVMSQSAPVTTATITSPVTFFKAPESAPLAVARSNALGFPQVVTAPSSPWPMASGPSALAPLLPPPSASLPSRGPARAMPSIMTIPTPITTSTVLPMASTAGSSYPCSVAAPAFRPASLSAPTQAPVARPPNEAAVTNATANVRAAAASSLARTAPASPISAASPSSFIRPGVSPSLSPSVAR